MSLLLKRRGSQKAATPVLKVTSIKVILQTSPVLSQAAAMR